MTGLPLGAELLRLVLRSTLTGQSQQVLILRCSAKESCSGRRLSMQSLILLQGGGAAYRSTAVSERMMVAVMKVRWEAKS